MATVTDLTGYTWQAIDNPDWISSVEANINFRSNNTNFTVFNVEHDTMEIVTDIYYGGTKVYDGSTETWTDNAFKTITISGGPDVTDELLIDCMEYNGTLTKASNSKIKLGTTTIEKVYLGSNEITKVYLGTETIFQK